MEELEKEQKAQKKQQEKKIKDLENLCKIKNRKDTGSDLEISKVNDLKCKKCDYTTTSKQGLKIHNARVHSQVNFDEFPAACDICEKILDNEAKLKRHKKNEHTYHYVKYQCNECEFMANEEQTLHVHFGREHAKKKQCGLCDKDFNDSKQLDDHLSKCEIFVCGNSGCRDSFEELSDIREHIKEEHRKNSPAHYQFSYWVMHAKDRSDNEVFKQYKTIYPKDW